MARFSYPARTHDGRFQFVDLGRMNTYTTPTLEGALALQRKIEGYDSGDNSERSEAMDQLIAGDADLYGLDYEPAGDEEVDIVVALRYMIEDLQEVVQGEHAKVRELFNGIAELMQEAKDEIEALRKSASDLSWQVNADRQGGA